MSRSSFMIGIIVVMISLSVHAFETWTDPETGIEWKYQVDGDNILICRGTPLKKDGTISALSEVPDTTIPATTQGMVVVPSKIQGKNVSVIGEGAFSGCNLLSSIVIPSSVTTIEGMAFGGCSGLTSVTLPVSVTNIGDGLFIFCSGLSSITIPSSVTNIPTATFYQCSGLTSITIPSSVKSIGLLAFGECDALKTICVADGDIQRIRGLLENSGVNTSALEFKIINEKLPDGGPYSETVDGIEWTFMVKNGEASVGSGAAGETAISKDVMGDITIPTTLGGCPVTGLGKYALAGCAGLRTVTIPEGIVSIGISAISCCTGVVAVSLPKSLEEIVGYSFYYCTSLTNIVLPANIRSVGYASFTGCERLRHVFISQGISYISKGAFSSCNAAMEVEDGCKTYCIIDDMLFSSDMSSIVYCPTGKCGDLLVPEGVKEFDFCGCSNLTSVSLPTTVTSIPFWSFGHCSSLTNVYVHEGLTSIGGEAFHDCNALASISIPSSVTSIGEFAFDSCINLTHVTIPRGVQSIGSMPFCNCFNLKSLDFEGAPPKGLVNAKIKADTIIRYNIAYENEWLSVVQECGFTNASPYIPELERTVNFVAPNGDVSERAHVYTNATYGLLPEARREGCTFAGWYTSLDGTNRVSAFSAVDPNVTTLFAHWVEDDASLYAQWSANAYSVNFNANGGTGSMMAQPFLYDQVQLLSDNVFTKLGYTFKGWSTSPDGDVVYSDGASVSNLTAEAGYAVALFARWEKIIDVETEEIEDWVAYELAPKFKRSDETKSAYRKRFEEKYGDDYEVAFFSETGKVGMDGTRLCVWHDYVAGTDPLDEKSQFTATIAIDPDTGKPTVDWSPNLGVTERCYTLHGKTNLQDTEWHVVNGDEEKYRFFKVTVEMP